MPFCSSRCGGGSSASLSTAFSARGTSQRGRTARERRRQPRQATDPAWCVPRGASRRQPAPRAQVRLRNRPQTNPTPRPARPAIEAVRTALVAWAAGGRGSGRDGQDPMCLKVVRHRRADHGHAEQARHPVARTVPDEEERAANVQHAEQIVDHDQRHTLGQRRRARQGLPVRRGGPAAPCPALEQVAHGLVDGERRAQP